MQVSHTQSTLSVSFDEPNLVGSAGLAPVMELAAAAGLHELAKGRLTVPTDKGANVGAKVAALVAGMCAGADSIDDMAILRHEAMKLMFSGCYALDTGLVPALVHLRARPPARRGRLPVPGEPGRPGPVAGPRRRRTVRLC